MNTDTMFSSASENWATPRAFFADLNREFHFDLDVCASPENAVVPRYFTKADDGLAQEWTGFCWMNPPYGRTIGQWMAKAENSARRGATVVALLPARTDTRWWHAYCQTILEKHGTKRVRFLPGRLHFNESKAGAPFPSVVVVFAP